MPGLIRAEDSVLLLVDIQERFRAAVPDMDRVIRRSVVLLKAALRLGVPVLASEQYPKALGTTVEEIRGLLPAASSTAAASSAS
ncbi:MAG TPA: isochorismatase family protein, partial [Fibrobacteria bacterium]|nr:isochorismatase family protein [Fibrobacteria bacterium]